MPYAVSMRPSERVTTESQTCPMSAKGPLRNAATIAHERCDRRRSSFLSSSCLRTKYAIYGMHQRAEPAEVLLLACRLQVAAPHNSRHDINTGCWLLVLADRLCSLRGKSRKWLELRSSATLGSPVLDNLAFCTKLPPHSRQY